MVESNTSILKEAWKSFFKSIKLSTHKITLIAIFLALTTVISLFSIPTFFLPFLTVDFGSTINLLSVYVIGLPYGILIAIIVPWLRLILPHIFGSSSGVIGEFSYMISGITTIIIYFLISNLLFFALKKVSLTKKSEIKLKFNFLFEIISIILTCLIVSLLNTFYNWAFLLDLYAASYYKKDLWTIFLPYNLFKYAFVLALFVLLKKPLKAIKNSFNL